MKQAINGHAVQISPRAGGRETGVIVSCHDVVCAIPVRYVQRLVLPEDVRSLGAGLVEIGRERYAAWDLGERLGLAWLRSSWVLLRVPYRGELVPVALRTGHCLMVQPLPDRVNLPRTWYATRPGAIAGVFPADQKHGSAAYGIELDVPHLWSPEELAASLELVRGGKAR